MMIIIMEASKFRLSCFIYSRALLREMYNNVWWEHNVPLTQFKISKLTPYEGGAQSNKCNQQQIYCISYECKPGWLKSHQLSMYLFVVCVENR